MKVLKFGGTSVGSASGIRNVKNIITAEEGQKIIVLSAMSGVTNELVSLTEFFREGNEASVAEILDRLEEKHFQLIEELFSPSEEKDQAVAAIGKLLTELKSTVSGKYSKSLEAKILCFGESLLTTIFSQFLKFSTVSNRLLDAKEFMLIANVDNPNTEVVRSLLDPILKKEDPQEIYITQGFVCRDESGNIGTLKRGGSDYTATIIGAAMGAMEVQIWTDIDGFHNNDPRYLENTSAIAHLTFDEAAELAYFGAKILHPQTVSPVRGKNIPIYLKNTFTPAAMGTKISSEVKSSGLKAISAKDGISAIKIKSNRMLMAHGFLMKIFSVFDQYKTAIDMITTSEIAISLTIDDISRLDQILPELQKYGEITVDHEQSIICIVGEAVIQDKKTYRLFEILNEVPVRMISYGGSSNNVSLLVKSSDKIQVLKLLNNKLFDKSLEMRTA